MSSVAAIRSGPRWWLSSYALSLRFDLSTQRAWLPMAVALQVLLGAGMALIYGFYVPNMPKVALTYLVAGAPTLALIPIGLVLLPALVGMQRTAGTYDFLWSLPVPRAVGVMSTLTVGSLLAIPGIVTTLVLAAWRYQIALTISWTVVPALLVTALMCASVGLALAHGVNNPVVVNLVSNTLVFVVLLFSPISFPLSQFPAWLAAVHQVLPFYHMANVVRASLTTGLVTDVWTSYAVLVAWTLAACAVTGWVVGRRG